MDLIIALSFIVLMILSCCSYEYSNPWKRVGNNIAINVEKALWICVDRDDRILMVCYSEDDSFNGIHRFPLDGTVDISRLERQIIRSLTK
jgi:hypothetical protein